MAGVIVEPTLTLGAIVSIGAVVGSAFTINGAIRKRHRENQQDAQDREDRLRAEINKHHASFEDRLKTVEHKVTDFMPRGEIERAIEHEKGNRTQADNALKERLDASTRDIVDIKVSVGRLEQQQAGTAASVGRVEELVREQGRDHAARFDKIQDCLNDISRKAA